MALSGSYDWTLNRDQVIKGALRKIGVLAAGESPTTSQTDDAAEALNALIKAWHAEGMPLWAITSHTFTVVDGTNTYNIGVGQTLNTVAPLRIFQAFYTLTCTGQSAVQMNVYNRNDFNILPNSTTIEGEPVNLYYQPVVVASDFKGIIKLWPTPQNSTTQVTVHYTRPFQDLDTSTDNLDFPAHYVQALIMNLAWVLCGEYGIPPQDRSILRDEALYWKNEALSIGTEEGSLFLTPARS